jgi:phosphonoacetaldehyde hydrolase
MRRVQNYAKYVKSLTPTIKLLVGDFSGTIIDRYSLAPITAFQNAFKKHNINISNAEIRKYMGLKKREHIEHVLKTSNISVNNKLVDQYYNEFESELKNLLINYPSYTQLLPYTKETIQYLKICNKNLKFGITTGFPKNMIPPITKSLHIQDFEWMINSIVAADEVPHSRPHADGINKIMKQYNITNPHEVIKIGDTPADMAEGLNAGAYTIGLVKYNNKMGEAVDNINDDKSRMDAKLLKDAYYDLEKVRPHFVIHDIRKLPTVFGMIEYRKLTQKNPYKFEQTISL